MNRRNFLSLFSAGVASIALEQAIPLGRVWSFPKKIVIPNVFLKTEWITEESLRILKRNLQLRFEIGDIVTFAKWPGRFVVSQIVGEEKVQLWSAEQRLVIRGVDPLQLTAAFLRDRSHTPTGNLVFDPKVSRAASPRLA